MGDLPLLGGGEGLVGDQGEEQLRERWHGDMIVGAVSRPSATRG